MDMHVEVPRIEANEFSGETSRGESSATVAARITRAREIQLSRQGVCNGRLSDAYVESLCALDPEGHDLLERSMKQRGFSARARQRILKLARTIADLDGKATVKRRARQPGGNVAVPGPVVSGPWVSGPWVS